MYLWLLPLVFALLPQAPDATLPPASAHVLYVTEGRGVQVYACTVQNGKFAWVFREPKADLFDTRTHQPVGTHTAGPTWTWNDGSEITGKLLKSVPSSDPANIPWLLLEAHSTGTAGALAPVAFVRRSDTQAGVPLTSPCDAEHFNQVASVPYMATYTFYTTN